MSAALRRRYGLDKQKSGVPTLPVQVIGLICACARERKIRDACLSGHSMTYLPLQFEHAAGPVLPKRTLHAMGRVDFICATVADLVRMRAPGATQAFDRHCWAFPWSSCIVEVKVNF